MKNSNVRYREEYLRFGVFILLIALLTIPLYTASSASSSGKALIGGHRVNDESKRESSTTKIGKYISDLFGPARHRRVLLPQAPPPPETIATFEVVAGICTTNAKNSFNLGETVCAKITGADLGADGRAARRIGWVSPYGSLAQGAEITTDPQNGFYVIPSTATQTFTDAGGGTVTVDNRGTWRVGLSSAADGSLREAAFFTVHDPAKAFVDLSVNQAVGVVESQVGAGSGGVFELFVTNHGPDAAQGVVLSDNLSDNATFSSIIENTPQLGFSCGTPVGTVFTCNLASMPAGATTHLTLSYMVNGDTPVGATITNTVSVASSDTPCAPDTPCELQPNDNSSTATAQVPTPTGAETCTIICHENFSAVANAFQGATHGALVTFSAGSVFGSCGAITATPASGTFFPVGVTIVHVTSETGGGSCTFTVTVVEATPPTITCPPDKTATASSVGGTATVAVGTPTTNPTTGVIVKGVRSDGTPAVYDDDGNVVTPAVEVPLTDPYPVGVTGIDWTVTDANGLTATCHQKVTVFDLCATDTETPTIVACGPLGTETGTACAVTAYTGPNSTTCGVALSPSDDELGSPAVHDDCSATIAITGVPAFNLFPVGVTTITYTATDGSGHTASANQTVTVIDNTPPVIAAPADASYTCLEQVPAASPSQATRGIVLDEDGNPLPPGPPFDNCGTPIVTVSESSTGAGTVASPRIITRTFTATDTSPLHSSSSAVQTITVIDPTPPTITCPANIVAYLPLNTTATSMPVSFSVGAQDNCAGVGVVSTPASGSTFPVGTTTVNSTATDAVGNTASCSFTVTVLYDFTGFFPPISNPPTINQMKAGQAAPVKFSLSGDKGLNIFAAGSPISMEINCDSTAPLDDVEQTVNAGGSSLSYDAASDQYNYVWKTDSSWKNTCRQLTVTLNDGSVHVALFKFK